jgi:hypothetical protein
MRKYLNNSPVSAFVAAGTVVAACMGGAAAPAAASPDSIPFYIGAGTVHTRNGVQLGDGEIIESSGKVVVELHRDADNLPKLVARWLLWDDAAVASAAFPILKDGSSTEYFVLARITTGSVFGANAWAECEIFYGKPGDGGNVAWGAPYSCDTARHRLDNDWDYTVRWSAQ